MKLSDMTDHERETLGTLIRLMVGADGATSPEESSDLQKVAAELGEADFWALVRQDTRPILHAGCCSVPGANRGAQGGPTADLRRAVRHRR